MINLGNGSVTINNARKPINWTGQYAKHITDNYISEKNGHTILHVEIQQALQKSRLIEKDGINSYYALTEVTDGLIFVSFIKSYNFVSITTGYKMKTTINKLQKKSIGKTKIILPIYNEQVEIELADGAFGNDEEIIKQRLIKLWTKIYKRKGYKNFELEFV